MLVINFFSISLFVSKIHFLSHTFANIFNSTSPFSTCWICWLLISFSISNNLFPNKIFHFPAKRFYFPSQLFISFFPNSHFLSQNSFSLTKLLFSVPTFKFSVPKLSFFYPKLTFSVPKLSFKSQNFHFLSQTNKIYFKLHQPTDLRKKRKFHWKNPLATPCNLEVSFMKVTFKEKLQLKIINLENHKHQYPMQSWSDKLFRVPCESDLAI